MLPKELREHAPRTLKELLPWCSQKLPRATYEAVCDSVLKEFKEAEYMVAEEDDGDVGHWALSLPSYMHFTSPIRRYADILVHRRLAFILGAQGDLESQSSHGAFLESLKEAVINCNTKKRDAQDAQMEEIQTVLSDYVQRSGGIDVDDAVLTRILVPVAAPKEESKDGQPLSFRKRLTTRAAKEAVEIYVPLAQCARSMSLEVLGLEVAEPWPAPGPEPAAKAAVGDKKRETHREVQSLRVRVRGTSEEVLLEKLQRLSVRLATVGAQDLESGEASRHWAIRLPWAEAAEKAPGATRAIDSTTAAAPAPTWCCVAVRVIPCAVLAAPVSSMGSTRGVSPMESMEQSKEEKVMPAEEGKPDTEEEPLHKLKSIAWGAGASMLAYGVVETLAEGDAEIAEDAVDFLHSTYTSCVAVSGISSLQPHSEHRVALPEDMAQIDGDGDRDIDGEGSADDEEVWLDDEGIAMQLNAYAAVASELEEDTLGEEYAEARCRGGIVVPALEQFRETLEGIDEHLLGDCLDRSEIKIFGAEVDRRFMAARHEMEEEAASCSDPVRRQSIIDEQNENKNQVIQLIGGARDYRIKLYVLLPLRLHGFVKPELYGDCGFVVIYQTCQEGSAAFLSATFKARFPNRGLWGLG
ncbi:SSD1 [Symbiodinium sp. KB8]|nr:SSD1 [Symbiodinium sp. KB8]